MSITTGYSMSITFTIFPVPPSPNKNNTGSDTHIFSLSKKEKNNGQDYKFKTFQQLKNFWAPPVGTKEKNGIIKRNQGTPKIIRDIVLLPEMKGYPHPVKWNKKNP